MAYKLASDMDICKRLPIGMIGGSRGSFFGPYHRAAIRLSNRWEMTAGVFSSDLEKSLEAAVALGVDLSRTYETVEDLAKGESARSDGIKAAVVVTPNHLHFDACKTLIDHHIGVICDKPLVNSLKDAELLEEIALRNGVFLV